MPIKSPKQTLNDNKIVIDDITCGYPSEPENILKNLSAKIPAHCLTAIVGSNGSGKSTFMRGLFGLQKLEHGFIQILGIDSQTEFRKLIKICSYVCQQPTADFEMTGLEILHYFGSMHGISKRSRIQRIQHLTKLLRLEKHISKKVASYSGGNLQKIHLAIGLINDPWLLMLDEPTNNLDAVSKHEVWSYLQDRSHTEQKTSVVISHDLDCVEKYSDQLIVMDHGKILYQGGTNEFINNTKIQKRYPQGRHHQHDNHCENPSVDQSIPRTSLFHALCSITDFHVHVSEKASIDRGHRRDSKRRRRRPRR